MPCLDLLTADEEYNKPPFLDEDDLPQGEQLTDVWRCKISV
jgi:hypothetical protein